MREIERSQWRGGGGGALRGEPGGTGSFPLYCERGDIPTPAGVKALHFMGSYFHSVCVRMKLPPPLLFEAKVEKKMDMCVCACERDAHDTF